VGEVVLKESDAASVVIHHGFQLCITVFHRFGGGHVFQLHRDKTAHF
jgi:hypothetical protein